MKKQMKKNKPDCLVGDGHTILLVLFLAGVAWACVTLLSGCSTTQPLPQVEATKTPPPEKEAESNERVHERYHAPLSWDDY